MLYTDDSTMAGDHNTSLVACRSVQATALKSIYQFVALQRGDSVATAVFCMAGIDLKWLGCHSRSIPLSAYCTLLEQAAKFTECDNFGLLLGDQLKVQAFGVLGYIALSASNVRLALKNFCQYFNFYQEVTLLSFKELNGVVSLNYQIQQGDIIQRRQNAEMMLSFIVSFIRQVFGRSWEPKEVYFEHPRPAGWMEHRKFFGTPVYFEQHCNSLLFSARELEREMPAQDPSLFALMQHIICSEQLVFEQALKQAATAPGEVLQYVRAKVREVLPYGEPKLEDIATSIQLPALQMIRSLKSLDYSFSKVVDEVRQELATYYLQQFQITVSELALLLGYSETSAFSRAFKRWFDCTPRQWRSMMLLQAS